MTPTCCAFQVPHRLHLVVQFSVFGTVTRLLLGSLSYCWKGVQGGSRSKFRSFPSFSPTSVVYIRGRREPDSKGALAMEWVTPQHEEIDLNCEISSYANAEL
jgi:hypothetical protein